MKPENLKEQEEKEEAEDSEYNKMNRIALNSNKNKHKFNYLLKNIKKKIIINKNI